MRGAHTAARKTATAPAVIAIRGNETGMESADCVAATTPLQKKAGTSAASDRPANLCNRAEAESRPVCFPFSKEMKDAPVTTKLRCQPETSAEIGKTKRGDPLERDLRAVNAAKPRVKEYESALYPKKSMPQCSANPLELNLWHRPPA